MHFIISRHHFEVWESSVLFLLSFFSAHRYDRNLFYIIRLIRISLTLCYKTKNTWRRHAAITGGCFIPRLAQPQGLLPLSHEVLCSLKCFFHGLVANLGKSHSSKSSQHHCSWSIFTAEPKLLASMRLHPVWHISPDRNAPSIIFLQILNLYMWPWFASSLQLHF